LIDNCIYFKWIRRIDRQLYMNYICIIDKLLINTGKNEIKHIYPKLLNCFSNSSIFNIILISGEYGKYPVIKFSVVKVFV